MKRLHIIGRKNHGKTTLVVQLLQEFKQRGLRVGSIKHTHHAHQLDVPGKDSHRHQEAGAEVVGVLSRGMSALFLPTDHDCPTAERYAQLAPAFEACDLVVVEGDIEAVGTKIEVWRASQGDAPIAGEREDIQALVTDDANPTALPQLQRSNLTALADWAIQHTVNQR